MARRHGVPIAATAVALLVAPLAERGAAQAPQLGRTSTIRSRLPPPRIQIQGRVVFGDGTPAPANVPIERVCGSDRPFVQTHTDSSGNFSFEIGELTGVTPDATQAWVSPDPARTGEVLTPMTGMLDRDHPDRIATRTLAGCSLQASLSGFHSTAVPIGRRDTFDDPDVGVIVLESMRPAGAMPVSIASLRAPDRSRDAYERGLKELREGRPERARKELEKAVREYPAHAHAWNTLGQIHEADGDAERARDAFEKAAAADETYLTPWLGLLRLDAHAGRWAEVARESERILSINPDDFPETYFYDAVASFSLGRHLRAELSARAALARGMQSQFPQVVHLLGLALANQGSYEEAALHLRRFLELDPGSDAAPAARRQLAAVEASLAEGREPPQ